ncbi:MAG TPA: PAS domain S-box protein [Chitinophagaceae bacterium]|nr:PAS domain S-box protein [Chitinophagaceae bacterium]
MSSKKSGLINWFILHPIVSGFMVFAVLITIGGLLTYQRYMLWKNQEERLALSTVESARSRLQGSLAYSQHATLSLALSLKEGRIPENIDSIAAEIMSISRFIDALQLVPGGTIEYVYPREGNESVIGYNILTDPSRNKEAYKAIQNRKLYFAGPFNLKQGGLGVVGRLPVFTTSGFWGFSAVVIRFNTLLSAAGIDTSGADGFFYQLSKVNPDTGKEEFFLPMKGQTKSLRKATVNVSDGEWQLSVSPVSTDQTMGRSFSTLILSFIIAVMGAVLTILILRRPAALEELVTQRTRELDESQERNRAIINALPDTIFIVDENNRFTDFINTSGLVTILPPDKFLNLQVDEVLPPDLAKEVINNLQIVRSGKPLITHQYQLEIGGVKADYEARYVHYGKSSVLVLVHDTSEKAEAERKLRESEIKYRTLVEKASDAIFIVDFTGKIKVVNPAGCKLAQYEEKNLLNRTIFEFTIGEDLDRLPLQFQALAEGKTVTTERRLRRNDMSVIEVEITASRISEDRFLTFIRDITTRKLIERELLNSREEFRQLSNYLENIREEERVSISREIHDELGQQLTVLKMDISRLGKELAVNEKFERDKSEILAFINEVISTVRKISSSLRPSLLDDVGLVPAMEWYCKDFSKRTGIQTDFQSGIQDLKLEEKIKTGLFRIFQESLTNVARHAGASQVLVSLDIQDQWVRLLVQDNGKGFNQDEIAAKKTLGILGIRERAVMMKGDYSISSAPGEGTITKVRVPIPATND